MWMHPTKCLQSIRDGREEKTVPPQKAARRLRRSSCETPIIRTCYNRLVDEFSLSRCLTVLASRGITHSMHFNDLISIIV
jgi:hypothetical protein